MGIKVKGFRGYIGSRDFGGGMIPQRVQNLVIRNYAQSRGVLYLLSATEYSMRDCDMILRGVLEELADLGGIIFYSTHLLSESPSRRKTLFDTVLKLGKELHFALEEIVIRKPEDIQMVEDIIMTRKISADAQAVHSELGNVK